MCDSQVLDRSQTVDFKDGEMAEGLKAHAWKLIPLACVDAHHNPPTHARSTTSHQTSYASTCPRKRRCLTWFRVACDTVLTQNRASFSSAVSMWTAIARRSFSFRQQSQLLRAEAAAVPQERDQADGTTGRFHALVQYCPSDRGLLERLEQDAHEVGAACARPHHNTLQIDGFHYRRRAGAIAIIGQRHLKAEPVVLEAAGRCSRRKRCPTSSRRTAPSKVAPNPMGERVRRTCGSVLTSPGTSGKRFHRRGT